jgi:hypothetical protein
MARILTLGTLVARSRQRYDGVGNDALDSPELKSLIDEYYADLHALVVEKGARYFETEATITATGATSYALPSDHLTTIAVDFVVDASTDRRCALHGPIAVQERECLIGSSGTACHYELAGASLVLYPRPSSGTYKHLYAPQPVDLSTAADSTQVDVINVYGQKYVLWGVASVAQHKSQSSQERAIAEYEKAKMQLEYWACLRAINAAAARVNEDERGGHARRYIDAADYRRTPA